MAGVKVTDLPVLSTADLADIFYIVEASGNQSKQVDLSTIATALSTALPYIHLRGTAFGGQGQVTGDIEVDQVAGGVITLRFGNGDIIALGVDYGGYSAISFYDATINETVYLYLRGGDLYLQNADTLDSISGIIAVVNGLQSNKVSWSESSINITPNAGNLGFLGYDSSTKEAYYTSDVIGRVGYRKLTKYFAKYSAIVSQTSTTAPTEVSVIESDFANPFSTASYTWNYQAVGHYHLVISGGVGGFNVDIDKTIVRITNGQIANVSYSTEVVSSGSNQITISVKTANPQTGNLTNALMTRTLIEVEFFA
jgi:hypothetical protein